MVLNLNLSSLSLFCEYIKAVLNLFFKINVNNSTVLVSIFQNKVCPPCMREQKLAWSKFSFSVHIIPCLARGEERARGSERR